jgi:serine/threonine protein phosphatase PrpC
VIAPAGLDVGACTHTGRVRSTNEDDLLLWAGPVGGELFLALLADGMGGLVGGAEASRLAVRAVAAEFADAAAAGERGWREVVERGFASAAEVIGERARRSPRLREMGTTLTAVALFDGESRFVVGHVGDTRCLLVRDGRTVQLTTDHALETASHLLTRCLGAGHEEGAPDVAVHELRPGDALVLVTDGVWGGVANDRVGEIAGDGEGTAQRAAERIVAEAFVASGSDNATAIVLRRARAVGEPDAATGEEIERVIRADEPPLRIPPLRPDRRLVAPRWPWIVWLFALLLGAVAWAGALGWVQFVPHWPFLVGGGG